MISPPTGRLFPTADGNDLVLSRTFRAPIEDVWASVTESMMSITGTTLNSNMGPNFTLLSRISLGSSADTSA